MGSLGVATFANFANVRFEALVGSTVDQQRLGAVHDLNVNQTGFAIAFNCSSGKCHE